VTEAGDRLVASVQTRLVRHAKAIGADPNVVLVRYATERLLYRLSRSEYASRFILKGALLLLAWLGETFRPTRDADLLGFGDLSDEALVAIFQELCSMSVEPDGLTFDASSVRVAEIRPQDEYGGRRVTLLASLGPARLKLQVDVGIGDAVEPPAEWLEYPALLDLPRPHLRAYRPETVIAEKLHAMVVLAARNSRMRDFFDIHALSARQSFAGGPLAQAIRATFDRRRTDVPAEAPIALSPSFAELPDKRAQWRAFLRKNAISGSQHELETVIGELAGFLLPPLAAAAGKTDFETSWLPGGPWRP
jgi:predicted nucleotidyltransferase component of viral defense system